MMQSQQIPMTFQRYETKYMLSPIMARKLRKSLPGHLQMDEYGLDTICSLYYDTPDHQLIRRSLEKPVYKEKLRLRSYGPAKETSPIYVELKKKYEGKTETQCCTWTFVRFFYYNPVNMIFPGGPV